MSSTVQTQSSYLPSEYFSGGLSISGLTGNGTDFTSMIDQLRKIEMIPTQRMLRWKSEWQQRQDAFGVVREALVNLRDVCAKMNTMDKFLVKTATSSQPNFATATASSSAIANSYKLEIKQEASVNIWSMNSEFAAGTTKVTASGTSGTFAYEYQGSIRSLTVPPDTSLEQLKNMINNDTNNPGVRASLIKSANGVTFQIKGMDTGAKNSLSILSTTGLTGGFAGQNYEPHKLVYKTSIANATGGDVYANTSGSTQVFTYSYNGVTRNVDIPGHATLETFKQKIEEDKVKYRADLARANSLDPDDASAANQAAIDALDNKLAGLTVNIEDDPSGNKNLVFTGSAPNQPITVPKGGAWENLGKPATVSTPPSGGNWHIKEAENAMIKVDGWPTGDGNWLEVSSNTVTDVVDGVTFNLIGEGTTVINVSTDTEAVTQNVVDFIDAVNNMRAVITELTKYDPNKTTVDYNYAQTQFEMQKGSLLTGNYGIQLISSRLKQATAGTPKGFLPQFKVGDLALGDLYTSLSQLGIKTKAEGSGGEGFGLLELNTDPSMPLLEDILKKNPEAVAEFFAAVNKGVSDSSDFSFVSSMQTITKAGAYNVTYELDTDGTVKPGTAFINGKAAKYYEDTGQIGLVRTDPQSADSSIATASSTGETDFTATVTVNQEAVAASSKLQTDMTDKGAPIATADGRFYYTYDGQEYSVNVTVGSPPDEKPDSLATLAQKINYHYQNPGVTATVEKTDGKWGIVIKSKEMGDDHSVTGVHWSFTPAGSSGIDAGNVTETTGKDANYEITYKTPNGAEKTITKTDGKSNLISLPGASGVSVTLKKAGTTTITGEKHNDADGIYIQVDNRTPGAYSSTVRVKQGKIGEILEMLNGTPNKPEEGILGSKGTLQVLVDNYNKIMDGIDQKIERETTRLIKWERTIKLRFSRLEATLKQYESLQASIESQVKQLGSNSSK
ncbi:hypothetical protein KL86DPRO_50285 [uncultured delta proteobacterium]|uniref:Filament cap protein n=1 Tax=uncultured delta proteobacterium TaxID=34034 RepID=A0A212KE57_9DELT|nr:hypothetical protein KL86DPRO_50285 [uncultured delta proteobacterium]